MNKSIENYLLSLIRKFKVERGAHPKRIAVGVALMNDLKMSDHFSVKENPRFAEYPYLYYNISLTINYHQPYCINIE